MTSEVIVPRRRGPHTGVMNLRRFVLIDTLALDVAGVIALLTGATTLGVVLLALAAVAFLTWMAMGRRSALVS